MRDWGSIFSIAFVVLLFVIVPIGVILFAIFGNPSTPVTAKKAYNKSLEFLKTGNKEAVLTELVNGFVPSSISGSVADYERRGKGTNWDLCFYSTKEDEFIFVGTSIKGNEIKQIKDTSYSGGAITHPKKKIDIKKWKIDSEEAIEIAKNKAEGTDREKFIIVELVLSQGKRVPIWSIEFLPPSVGQKTTGFKVIINGETGKVMNTFKPSYRYLPI